MRLLHTGDWHVGKRLYGVDRLGEFNAAIAEITAIARAEEVDAILMSGDIMDRRIVEPIVLSTCLQAFERLAEVAPVVAVTGNHDEPLFWAEIAPYLAPRILIAASDAVFGLDTAAGRLTVACLPWPEPVDAGGGVGEDRGTSRARYAEMVADRLTLIGEQAAASRNDHGGVAVLLAHLMGRGGVSGGGERELTLAGTYAVPGDAIPATFAYAALGHLHRPQRLAAAPCEARYCGSPLALDFSGEGEAPSVTIVTIEEDATRTRQLPVAAGRQLVRLRGRLAELPALAAQHDQAWFFCEVEGEAVRLDVVREVRDLIPQALRVEQVGLPARSDDPDTAGEPLARSLPELYAQWLDAAGRPADEALVRAFSDSLDRAGSD